MRAHVPDADSKIVVDTKYAWLENPQNFRRKVGRAFAARRDSTLKSVRAWAMKESLRGGCGTTSHRSRSDDSPPPSHRKRSYSPVIGTTGSRVIQQRTGLPRKEPQNDEDPTAIEDVFNVDLGKMKGDYLDKTKHWASYVAAHLHAIHLHLIS